jgi:hypothetical protein
MKSGSLGLSIKFNIASQAILALYPLVSIPWAILFLGLNNYGETFEALTTCSIYIAICTLGAASFGPVLAQSVASNQRHQVFSYILSLQFRVCILLSPLLLLYLANSDSISVFTPYKEASIALLLIYCISESLNPAWYGYYTGNGKVVATVSLISRSVGLMAIILSPIALKNSRLLWYLLVLLMPSLIQNLGLAVALYRSTPHTTNNQPTSRLKFDQTNLKNLLVFAAGSILPGISINLSWKITQSFLSPSTVGALSATHKLVQQLRIVGRTTISTILGDYRFREVGRKALVIKKETRGKILQIALIAVLAIFLCIPLLVLIFSNKNLSLPISPRFLVLSFIFLVIAAILNFLATLLGTARLSTYPRGVLIYGSSALFSTLLMPLFTISLSEISPSYALTIAILFVEATFLASILIGISYATKTAV